MSQPRALLLMSLASYRASSFLAAARGSGIEPLIGLNLPPALVPTHAADVAIDFRDVESAVAATAAYARDRAVDAILAVDDSATVIAARAAAAVGLPGNDPAAAAATRDKYRMRSLLAAAGRPTPPFARFPATADPAKIAGRLDYPCVVKPTDMSGSRGVIRADDPPGLVAAWERTRAIVASEQPDLAAAWILVECFWSGFEVAVEGILTEGRLQVLALFDKPDPLEGPFFEETLYVTPSRLPDGLQAAIAREVEAAAGALGLRTGPIHAELRIRHGEPWLVEMAARSIGGLCSTVLSFGTDLALEDIILRHAVGLPIQDLTRTAGAAGVMMIPIPARGILKGVHGVELARGVPLVQGVEIAARLNYPLIPLPEGASYLGFIFARGDVPAAVEDALRQAHRHLAFDIRPELPVINAGFTPGSRPTLTG